MSETLAKLRPDRDLQCYFYRPSAIAALSETSAGGFTVSGTWRQQFDWAVIEWNRDNVFEHPSLRPLPDGDLSGLTLSYRETRVECIPMDSGLYPTVDWPYLRIWADDENGVEQIYRVRLADHATAVQGSYTPASATFSLGGSFTAGDSVELAWRNEHYNHTVQSGETVGQVLEDLASTINALSSTVSAAADAQAGTITIVNLAPGEEGNRLGVVATVGGFQTEHWTPAFQTLAGGVSPTEWQVDLDFSSLNDIGGGPIPTTDVRKMRWTYSAALQVGAYQRSEFAVTVSNWVVGGTGRSYVVAGPSSRRIENGDVSYSGTWTESQGNFSGGSIYRTVELDASCTAQYQHLEGHRLFLGVRRTYEAGIIAVSVDGGPEIEYDLFVPGEDFLARLDLGAFGVGSHTVVARLVGQNPASSNQSFYFDFVEAAAPTATVSPVAGDAIETLATDWDTDHSVVLAPERVVWNLVRLGFRGRANHYVGAILFYELENEGNAYATGTVTFSGQPAFSQTVEVIIDGTSFARLALTADTNETIAKSFEYLINDGSTGVRAEAVGPVLTVSARALGAAGNAITLSASPTSGAFLATASGATLSGGVDGVWRTDLSAIPRLNRAARDWHRSYFAALLSEGVEGTAAFSTELSHGDPSAATGIAQRYPNGSAVLLNTPAIQTNFSSVAVTYWKQVYLEMAQLQAEAGQVPYLQFGEVQWWYFPGSSGMTFYDAYTTTQFQSLYGRALHVFASNDETLDGFAEEAEFLPGLIGSYTAAIRNFVLAAYPNARFEVLYPHDVNDHPLTRVVNYPDSEWTTAHYETLKTENFTYTGDRNLNKSVESIRFPQTKGFSRAQSAHLIGVFNASEPWDLERRLSRREAVESVALWAFDQFSMIGYRLPLRTGLKRSLYRR
ncbi:MAG: hypothetical protein GC160_19490 [Acidobacteria bacterium]|nr:hypothetical protein [Acidobacteriota bacterium]